MYLKQNSGCIHHGPGRRIVRIGGGADCFQIVIECYTVVLAKISVGRNSKKKGLFVRKRNSYQLLRTTTSTCIAKITLSKRGSTLVIAHIDVLHIREEVVENAQVADQLARLGPSGVPYGIQLLPHDKVKRGK